MGRTGSLWAYQLTDVVPDAITSAKALGGGLPIGALITGERLADVFELGDHGSTFAGGPVASSAALVALDICSDPELLERVRELGAQLMARLESLPYAAAVRGRGLMVALDIEPGDNGGAPELVRRALFEERLVVNATGPATIRLEPPLIVSPEEIDEAVSRLGSLAP
jgi:acetylornithine/succinyldiaminopimelate/putrescine aminotransferase